MPTNEGKAMTIDIEIYQGSMNVYADLGYPDAEEMLIKAQSATGLVALIC
jgi:hypothetical protein